MAQCDIGLASVRAAFHPAHGSVRSLLLLCHFRPNAFGVTDSDPLSAGIPEVTVRDTPMKPQLLATINPQLLTQRSHAHGSHRPRRDLRNLGRRRRVRRRVMRFE